MNKENDKHHLWAGSADEFLNVIDYMQGRNVLFKGWDGCSFLHQDIESVRGMNYEESNNIKGKLKFPEVRGYATSWKHIYDYCMHKYSKESCFVVVERKVCDDSDDLFVKRMDAIIVCLKKDSTSSMISVSVEVVEYKYSMISNVQHNMVSLLEYYYAVSGNPSQFVDVAWLTNGKYHGQLRYVIEHPVMLMGSIDCPWSKCDAETANYFRGELQKDLNIISFLDVIRKPLP